MVSTDDSMSSQRWILTHCDLDMTNCWHLQFLKCPPRSCFLLKLNFPERLHVDTCIVEGSTQFLCFETASDTF